MDLRFGSARASTAERRAIDAILGPASSGWQGGKRRADQGGRFSHGGQEARARRHLLLPALHAAQARVQRPAFVLARYQHRLVDGIGGRQGQAIAGRFVAVGAAKEVDIALPERLDRRLPAGKAQHPHGQLQGLEPIPAGSVLDSDRVFHRGSGEGWLTDGDI